MLSKDEEDCFTAVTFPGLASVCRRREGRSSIFSERYPACFQMIGSFIRTLRPVPNGVLQLIYIFGDA
jgi:hypothetical protein